MNAPKDYSQADSSRRIFSGKHPLAWPAAAATAQVPLVHAGSGAAAKVAEIKIGLIGCGGRGTGATLDALGAATKVIYPSEGYHTEDVAEGARSRALEHQGRGPGRPVPGPA